MNHNPLDDLQQRLRALPTRTLDQTQRDRILAGIAAAESSPGARPRSRSFRWPVAVAAAILLSTAALLLWRTSPLPSSGGPLVPSMAPLKMAFEAPALRLGRRSSELNIQKWRVLRISQPTSLENRSQHP